MTPFWPQSAENTARQTCSARLTEARQAGFDEINMDLIAGLTGDTRRNFCTDCGYFAESFAGEYHGAHARHQARR